MDEVNLNDFKKATGLNDNDIRALAKMVEAPKSYLGKHRLGYAEPTKGAKQTKHVFCAKNKHVFCAKNKRVFCAKNKRVFPPKKTEKRDIKTHL